MYTIRNEQFAALRKKILGDNLIKSFAGGRQTASRDPQSGDVLITDPNSNTIRCAFDRHGYIGRVTGPLGRTYQLENDAKGRLLGLTIPSGSRLGLTYDQYGRTIAVARNTRKLFDLAYDDTTKGLASVSYPNGTTSRIQYAAPFRPGSFTDRRGVTVGLAYDGLGRVTSLTDGNGIRTSFQYGGWMRPDQAIYADGSSESYEYYGDGRVRRLHAGGQLWAELGYDSAGRPTAITYGDGERLRFASNAQGKRTEAVSPEMTVKCEYNAHGQLVREDQGGQVVAYHLR
jgi:YD repeat-containing protein